MNVVPLTAIRRKCGRCRPRRGSDRVALRRAQRNASDWRANLSQLIVEADAFQQPSSVRINRDPGSDLPENLGLLEYSCIEASRPKRERSGQTSDTAADNCNAKRTRHFSHTLAVSRNRGTM